MFIVSAREGCYGKHPGFSWGNLLTILLAKDSFQLNEVTSSASKKIVPLESMRGLAAFMVFLFHFILGFMPQRHGQERNIAIPGENLLETPFFSLINGHAAVTFFFVLSGFVLSYSYFSKGTNDGLLGSVIKRWPRLFPMALISTLFSWLMIHHGFYSYVDVAQITKSGWMARFASSSGDFLNASFSDAFMQGFFFSFFRGDYNLNTSLWTMHYEFIGSLLVFGLIPVLNGIHGKVALILMFILLLAAFFTNAYMCAFIMGCFLSYYRCQLRSEKGLMPVNKVMLILSLLLVFLAFGYFEPGYGFYSFINEYRLVNTHPMRIIIHSVAAVILIQIILNYESVYKLFDGSVGRFLGRCSFALYVIHVPLMFVFSTGLFLSVLDSLGYRWAVFITFVATVPILFLASWLMTLFDEFWCKNVNKTVKKYI